MTWLSARHAPSSSISWLPSSAEGRAGPGHSKTKDNWSPEAHRRMRCRQARSADRTRSRLQQCQRAYARTQTSFGPFAIFAMAQGPFLSGELQLAAPPQRYAEARPMEPPFRSVTGQVAGDGIHEHRRFRSARGGPSLAAAGYDAASKVEAQLPRPRSEVSAGMLPLSEPPAHVRVNVHGLRLLHVRHGDLLDRAGESLRLQRASARRRACEPGRSTTTIEGGPVTALCRISVDSFRVAKPWGCA